MLLLHGRETVEAHYRGALAAVLRTLDRLPEGLEDFGLERLVRMTYQRYVEAVSEMGVKPEKTLEDLKTVTQARLRLVRELRRQHGDGWWRNEALMRQAVQAAA